MTVTAPLTVVVPVYGGLDDLRACLDSVFRHAPGGPAFVLHVVDDASPQPEVGEYLRTLAATPPALDEVTLELSTNPANRGFVQTCNLAMRGAAGDVVLLNSDTVVTAGWLDRMVSAARADGVASVTPLTNFGSICTLPEPVIAAFDLAGPGPRIDACAAYVRDRSLGRRPAVITGVGFCMYLTRAALDACGLFDEEAFGLGYGEEVDLCLRATDRGFHHVVEDSTFVYHRGGVSFSERREEGLRRASEVVHRRHPSFRARNMAERDDDPLRVPFAALTQGLVSRSADRRLVLQLLHSKPGELGGTEKHFWSLVDGLLAEVDVAVLQPARDGFLLTTLWSDGTGAPTTEELLLPFPAAQTDVDVDDPGAAAALEATLGLFDFDAVHIQNIVHHSLAPLDVLADFPGPVSCSVRDLYLACPHHWLLYRNERSCGIPEDLSFCARCLPETRNHDLDFLQEFRATVAGRIDTVDHWVFASQSAVDFFLRAYEPEADRIEVIEHGAIIDHERGGRAVDEERILDEPLRLAFVGIGWAKKGLPAVNELAEALAGTDIEIHHFGELRDPISPRIHEHGRYDNNELPELLRRAGIQVVLLPGPFIETFGHVMTEALISGLPVIGNRYGALGERIRAHGVGWTIDPEDVPGMLDLIVSLDRCRPEVLRATRRAVAVPLRSVDDTVERYAALYRPAAGADPRTRSEQMTSDPGVELTNNERERMRRELRAMAAVNRQLQVQVEDAERRARAAARARPVAPSATPKARTLAGRAKRSIDRRGLVGAAKAAARKLNRTARSRLAR